LFGCLEVGWRFSFGLMEVPFTKKKKKICLLKEWWPCLNPANTNVIEAFERVVKWSDSYLAAMFETCQYQHY
jgi:hypothetical protein